MCTPYSTGSNGCSLLMHPSTGRLIAPTCSCDRQRDDRGSIWGTAKFLELMFSPKYFLGKYFLGQYFLSFPLGPCPPPLLFFAILSKMLYYSVFW